jgi:nicotinamide phosphoribosyltransferase
MNQQESHLPFNLILMTDSYKLSHAPAYPAKMSGMHAYIEARLKGSTVVLVGLQMLIKKWLLTPITLEMIHEAAAFAMKHGEPFNNRPWEKVLYEYNGLLPLTIRAVPEGLRVPGSNVLVTIECDDPDLAFLASYIETLLQGGVWYPTTIASNDYKAWRILKRYNAESSDNPGAVDFMLHDFGFRGVSSVETAEIGGAAHCVFFTGSDNIQGVRAANFYYNHEMAAYSVPASEHSVQCSYGETFYNQREYLRNMLKQYAREGSIVSIVLDGYDVYREAQQLCELKDEIVASGARIVFRPDSGDASEVVPKILAMQANAFGYKLNSKGYKVINNVGVLQGDGIDNETMTQLLELVTELGYSTDNIVFGSGGGLLQKVNRDTYKFAQKASAIKIHDQWVPIWKDPVTDPGKRSKSGRLTLVRSRLTGEFSTVNIDKPLDSEYEDMMVTVYDHGKLLVEHTLDEIRARAKQ